MKKTIALIPLRGGSKSIPLKNIKPIANKPLCVWVLEAALNAQYIDEVYVSTESELIKELVKERLPEVKIIHRPDEFATDDASTESVMLHFMENVNFSKLVTIQATSPMLCPKHLDEALNKFENENLDSLLSAVRIKRFFWTDQCIPLNYNFAKRPRRQEFNGTLMENGAFYITKKEILEKESCRLGGRIGIYEMPENCAVEIDEPEDWDVVSKHLEGIKEKYDYYS